MALIIRLLELQNKMCLVLVTFSFKLPLTIISLTVHFLHVVKYGNSTTQLYSFLTPKNRVKFEGLFT